MDGKVHIEALGEKEAWSLPHFNGIIKDVSALGFDEKPVWERTKDSLNITTNRIKSDKPVVFKITIE